MAQTTCLEHGSGGVGTEHIQVSVGPALVLSGGSHPVMSLDGQDEPGL